MIPKKTFLFYYAYSYFDSCFTIYYSSENLNKVLKYIRLYKKRNPSFKLYIWLHRFEYDYLKIFKHDS